MHVIGINLGIFELTLECGVRLRLPQLLINKSQPMRDPKDMGIHREHGPSQREHQHARRGLWPDAVKAIQKNLGFFGWGGLEKR